MFEYRTPTRHRERSVAIHFLSGLAQRFIEDFSQ
jgi:hypothetical protein